LGWGLINRDRGQAFALSPEKPNRETASPEKLQSKSLNIYAILNGAPQSEESLRLNKERFFAALRMTTKSSLIAFGYQARFGQLGVVGRSFSETGKKLNQLPRPRQERGEGA